MRTKILAVCAALVAVAVVALAIRAVSGDDDGTDNPASEATSAPAATTKGPQRIGPAPRAVPAVRDWQASRGPGWKPAEDSRVVADPDGPLAEEARLLARELDLSYSEGPARVSDVELRHAPDSDIAREGYILSSKGGQVRITGSSDAGVFYGTRTLLQAVRDRGGLADGVVRDQPDRSQRGFMLDIARKHFSAEWIKKRIREMGDLKLNQLQLHLSDDQAFRIASESHPEVVSDPHLSKKQIREIVRLAKSRHITVIPEIDSPGHLGAVLEAHPDLRLRDGSGEPVPGAVNIADPKAARVIDDLLNEYADLFPGEYWHLGGDEYAALTSEDPEAEHPGLARAARKQHGADAGVQDLATSWLNDRAEVVRKHGKTPQVWNDGMHADGTVQPDRKRQVTYWTGKEIGAREPEEYLDRDWKLINMNDEYLYYVLGEPNDFTYPTGERIYEEWTPAVLRGTDPVPAGKAAPKQVLGGRFAVWCDLAEAQTRQEVAEGIRLPLAATAQKLWDPREPKLSWSDFTARVDRVD